MRMYQLPEQHPQVREGFCGNVLDQHRHQITLAPPFQRYPQLRAPTFGSLALAAFSMSLHLPQRSPQDFFIAGGLHNTPVFLALVHSAM